MLFLPVLHSDSLYHTCCYRFFQLGFLNYPNLENGWRHLNNSWHFPCMQPSSGCSGHYKVSCNLTRRLCEKKSLNRKKDFFIELLHLVHRYEFVLPVQLEVRKSCHLRSFQFELLWLWYRLPYQPIRRVRLLQLQP